MKDGPEVLRSIAPDLETQNKCDLGKIKLPSGTIGGTFRHAQ
tara:strand:+ start:4499 stop:4624 length:126 start_codon:yes stop_codon:yes gene_type:complete